MGSFCNSHVLIANTLMGLVFLALKISSTSRRSVSTVYEVALYYRRPTAMDEAALWVSPLWEAAVLWMRPTMVEAALWMRPRYGMRPHYG
jgi:hypothetical protein